jgi:hypothetical protein
MIVGWRAGMTFGLAACLCSGTAASGLPMVGDKRVVQPGAFPASGQVRCAGGTGAAQLVGSQRVIVTAGHVLIGRGGPGSSCSVTFRAKGGMLTVPIDMSSLRAGSSNPLAEPARQDWAVARLDRPVTGVRPFATASAAAGQQVTLVSGRTVSGRGGPTIETCRIRGRTPGSGELAIDCSAEAGDSGAALVTVDGRVAAIYVGFRSTTPGRSAEFSETHYNFALPVGGAISAAIRELAR